MRTILPKLIVFIIILCVFIGTANSVPPSYKDLNVKYMENLGDSNSNSSEFFAERKRLTRYELGNTLELYGTELKPGIDIKNIDDLKNGEAIVFYGTSFDLSKHSFILTKVEEEQSVVAHVYELGGDYFNSSSGKSELNAALKIIKIRDMNDNDLLELIKNKNIAHGDNEDEVKNLGALHKDYVPIRKRYITSIPERLNKDISDENLSNQIYKVRLSDYMINDAFNKTIDGLVDSNIAYDADCYNCNHFVYDVISNASELNGNKIIDTTDIKEITNQIHNQNIELYNLNKNISSVKYELNMTLEQKKMKLMMADMSPTGLFFDSNNKVMITQEKFDFEKKQLNYTLEQIKKKKLASEVNIKELRELLNNVINTQGKAVIDLPKQEFQEEFAREKSQHIMREQDNNSVISSNEIENNNTLAEVEAINQQQTFKQEDTNLEENIRNNKEDRYNDKAELGEYGDRGLEDLSEDL